MEQYEGAALPERQSTTNKIPIRISFVRNVQIGHNLDFITYIILFEEIT